MRRPVIIIALGLASVVVLAYWLLRLGKPTTSQVLRLSGHIEATETDLAFKVPGKIAVIHFQEGDTVKAGQVVAKLEDQDLRQELAAAEGKQAAAAATLEKLLAGFRPQEVKEAKAAVAQAQADYHDKTLDYNRMENLFQRRVVAASTRDKAEAAYLMAKEAVRRAQENYDLKKEGYRREDIDAGRADLKQAQANAELARTRLGYATITSPVNGVVLARPAEPGEVAAVGSTVITLGDLDNVWFEGYIPEPDLAKARYGMKAAVTTDTYPGKKYPAWVSYIAAKAQFTPKSVETFKERVTLVYRTKVRCDNPQHELKPGMPAAAVLFLEPPSP